MKTTKQHDFGTGCIVSSILRLAIPMIFAQLINVLYNIVDRIYIGHIPEAAAESLTGVGLALPVITIVTAFANLFGMGGAPLFSMARGAGDEKRAARIMGNSFSMLIITGLFLSMICFIFKKPLLYLFGASNISFPYADSYLTIYLFGTFFVMISLGMNPFINSQGFGVVGMFTVAIGAVINLILDPLFIFVFHMNVQGAALATVISQGFSALWVLLFLTGKKAILPLRRENLHIQISLVKSIAGLGLSGFMMSITNGSVQIACNAMLARYGGDLYVGIMTVINSVREIVTLPVNGLTSGSQPVLSFNYGAKKYGRVKAAIKFVTLLCTGFLLFVWALLFFFPSFFIRIFNSDPTLMEIGVPALHIYFFGIFMMALQFAGQSTFVALGHAKHAVFFSIFRKIIIVVPLTIILPRVGNLGTDGVFMAEPISNFVGGTASFVTMLFTVWRKLGKEEN